jgi:hypothetical protein
VIPLKKNAEGTEPQFHSHAEQAEESMDLTWDPQFNIEN